MNLSSKSKFYKDLFLIAVPVIIQTFFTSILGIIDSIMIIGKGNASLVAVSISNQLFFVYVMIIGAFSMGEGVFVSQFFGKKDKLNFESTFHVSLMLQLYISIGFYIIAFFFCKNILQLFTTDQEVIRLGIIYLKNTAPCYIFTAIVFTYSSLLRNIGQAKFPIYASLVAVTLKTFLNYVLIYGHFGMPSLGIRGAAVATYISRFFEMLIIVIIVILNRNLFKDSIKTVFTFNKNIFQKILKLSLPMVLTDALWVVGSSVYFFIYTRVGTVAAASFSIVLGIQGFIFVLFTGLATFLQIVVSKKLGENNSEESILYIKKILRISFILSGVLCLVLYFLAPYILDFYHIQDIDTYFYSLKILRILSFVLFIKTYNLIIFNGVLKAGGDNVFSLMLNTSSTWILGLPITFLFAFVLNLSVEVIFLISTVEEILKAILVTHRYKSKKWMHNFSDVHIIS
jgi:putative MATE family efflux protein